MTNNIEKSIQALNGKMGVIAGELNLTGPNMDGLFDHHEYAAMITGLLGGKGALPNETDLNDVNYGGTYYLPQGSTYVNHPFESNLKLLDLLPAQIEVIRNFGADPHTKNPLVYQKFTTFGHTESLSAYRFWYGGSWLKWHYPEGKMIWRGSVSVNSTIKVTDPVTDFAKVEIFWNPYGLSTRSTMFTSPQTYFQLHAINMPDDQNASNPAISNEEVDVRVWSDNQTLTASHSAFYIQNGVTKATDIIAADKTRIVAIKGYTEL